ncbi:unnamed protein product, partial [Rotaria sp. Silwood1]
VFGIVRIIKTAPLRVVTATVASNGMIDGDESLDAAQAGSVKKATVTTDTYALIEDITKLIIELIAILFAILATFVLFRYVKAKYAEVPTNEPKAATSS